MFMNVIVRGLAAALAAGAAWGLLVPGLLVFASPLAAFAAYVLTIVLHPEPRIEGER